MQTLLLAEHEPVQLRLSAQEERELRTLPSRLLTVTAQRDGALRVAPRSWVGAVALPSLMVVIRPKVDVRNVLFLLAYARKIHWGLDDFAYDTDDLVQAIAWWFDREAERSVRFGLPRDYLDREEALTTVRGRIVFDRQLTTRAGQRMPIVCRYQDYSEDTPLNRLVKVAHEALLLMPGLDHALRRRLRHRVRSVFGDVRSSAPGLGTPPDPVLLRRHREWRSTVLLAQLILSNEALRDGFGDIAASAFTMDMNLLFQQFVAEILRERLAAVGTGTLVAGGGLPFTAADSRADGVVVPAVSVFPDLVIRNDGAALAVADVKYKVSPARAAWEPPDAYQLVTYCVRLGLERGLLVYCGADPLAGASLIGTQLRIETVGVDLSGSPSELLASARRAADALIEQAGESPRATARPHAVS